MRATSERKWILGAAGLGLLVVLVGWFFLIAPQRAATDDVQSQTADAQTQNLVLQGRITNLAAQSKKRADYNAALIAARQALPAGTDISQFLRSMQSIAVATSTRMTALNVGEPEPFTPIVSTKTPAGPMSGVFAIAIDASVVGSPGGTGNFLSRLQAGQPRAVLITSVTRGDEGGGSAVMQVKLNVFLTSPSG